MSHNTVDLNSVADTVAAYRAIKEQIKTLSETADTLALDIKAALGDNEVGTVDGRPVVTWKVAKRRSFSQKLCRELHPEVFEECQDTTETRSFRLAD